jgi:hypothetical protein
MSMNAFALPCIAACSPLLFSLFLDLGIIIYNCLICSILALPLYYALLTTPDGFLAITAFALMIVAITSVCVLLLPKAYLITFCADLTKRYTAPGTHSPPNLQKTVLEGTKASGVYATNTPYSPTNRPATGSIGQIDPNLGGTNGTDDLGSPMSELVEGDANASIAVWAAPLSRYDGANVPITRVPTDSSKHLQQAAGGGGGTDRQGEVSKATGAGESRTKDDAPTGEVDPNDALHQGLASSTGGELPIGGELPGTIIEEGSNLHSSNTNSRPGGIIISSNSQ